MYYRFYFECVFRDLTFSHFQEKGKVIIYMKLQNIYLHIYSEGNFISMVEKAISNGSLLVIDNLDQSVDSVLYSLIFVVLNEAKFHEKTSSGRYFFIQRFFMFLLIFLFDFTKLQLL